MENNKREREETKDDDEDVLYPWAKKKPRHMRLISGRNRTVMQEALVQFDVISKEKPMLYLLLSIDNYRTSRYVSGVWPKCVYNPRSLDFLLSFPTTQIKSAALQVNPSPNHYLSCSIDSIMLLPDFTYAAKLRIHYLSCDHNVTFRNTVEQEDVFNRQVVNDPTVFTLACGQLAEWQESEKIRYKEVTRQVYAADTPLTEDVLMCILSYLVYD